MKKDRESTEMIVYLERKMEEGYTKAWLVLGIGKLYNLGILVEYHLEILLLRGLNKPGLFCCQFYIFCDFQVALMHSLSHLKRDFLCRENICSQREQIFHCRVNPFSEGTRSALNQFDQVAFP